MKGMYRKVQKGFTIIEILISIVILTVGILGILAIFPRAIESASKSIEDTYAGVIAQSVMDATKTGVRETKVTQKTAGNTVKYFLLQHDGVGFKSGSGDITKIDITNPSSVVDYRGSIIMPTANMGKDAVFIYPKSLSASHFQGSSSPKDDRKNLGYVEDIYAFGNRSSVQGVSVLQDLLSSKGNKITQRERRAMEQDPYLSYGFALVINRSVLNTGDKSDDLFMVGVWVFRNWIKGKGHPNNKPIKRLNSLVAF